MNGWEGLLNNFHGSVLLVFHDRRFLDNVATRIVELDRGKLASFFRHFSGLSERQGDRY